jgi:hypothetical protein
MRAALAKAMRQPNALPRRAGRGPLKQGRYEEAFTEIGGHGACPERSRQLLQQARILNATGRAAEAESVRWAMRFDPLYSPEIRACRDFAFHQQRYGGGRDRRGCWH